MNLTKFMLQARFEFVEGADAISMSGGRFRVVREFAVLACLQCIGMLDCEFEERT